MAVIPSYERSQGLDPGSAPSVHVDTSFAEALSSLGTTVEGVADHLQARQNQEEDYQAAKGYAQTKAGVDQAWEEQSQNMPADGAGVHDQFTSQTVKPAFDKFLGTLPPRLQSQYAPRVISDQSSYSLTAAKAQRSAEVASSADLVNQFADHSAGEIVKDPTQVAARDADMIRTIDASKLGPLDKVKAKENWAEIRSQALVGTMPARTALVQLGGGTLEQNAAIAVEKLVPAMIQAESSGNPNVKDGVAANGQRAVGLMQVQAPTAREVVRLNLLGKTDPNFPIGQDDAAVEAYLKKDGVSQAYGTAYLGYLVKKYDGNVEHAVAAYNWGPTRVDAWVKAGADPKALPGDVRSYVDKVLGGVGLQSGAGGKASGVTFKWSSSSSERTSAAPTYGMKPELVGAIKQGFAASGLGVVSVTTGYRPAKEDGSGLRTNAAAGGVPDSDHLRGEAADLDVSGMSIPDRQRLIASLKNAGVTSFGIGANYLHVGISSKLGARSWGYNPDGSPNAPVPDWAKEAIASPEKFGGTVSTGVNVAAAGSAGAAAHAANVAPTAGNLAVNPLLNDLSYADRVKLIARATTEDTAAAAQLKGDYRLAIKTGEVHDPAVILSDRRLDSGTQADLLGNLETELKETHATQSAFADLAAGNKGNPYDEDDRKRFGKAYDAAGGAKGLVEGDAHAAAMLGEFVDRSGVVPASAVQAVQLGINGNDPKRAATALEIAASLTRQNPRAWDAYAGGDAIAKEAAVFDHLTTDLGYSSEDAAKKMLGQRDPALQRTEKELTPIYEKEVKNLAVGDVTGLFYKPGFLGTGIGSTSASPGLTPAASEAIMADYRERFKDELVAAGGDAAQAKARALVDMKKLYGVTGVGMNPTVMRLPPENFYPPVGGSYDYLKTSAFAAAEKWVGSLPGATTIDAAGLTPKQLAARGLWPPTNHPHVADVMLIPSAETVADIKDHQPPRYRLLVERIVDGQPVFDEVPDGLFRIPAQGVKAAQDAANLTAADANAAKLAAAKEQAAAMQKALNSKGVDFGAILERATPTVNALGQIFGPGGGVDVQGGKTPYQRMQEQRAADRAGQGKAPSGGQSDVQAPAAAGGAPGAVRASPGTVVLQPNSAAVRKAR